MVLGIDAGNYAVKTAGEHGVDYFLSNIIPGRSRRLDSKHGNDDMVVEYQDKTYFAGSLAKYEDQLDSGTLAGESKNHDEAKLRILLAVHRNVKNGETVKLVVGQPISKHTEDEKKGIVERLKGPNTMTINGEKKTFDIEDVRVGPEGAAAFWCKPQKGAVHILDVGSGASNWVTITDSRYVDGKSGTIPIGTTTIDLENPELLAEAFVRRLSRKWKAEADIRVIGGGALELLPYFKQHFVNAEVFLPTIQREADSIEQVGSVYANAIGLYTMAKGAFK